MLHTASHYFPGCLHMFQANWNCINLCRDKSPPSVIQLKICSPWSVISIKKNFDHVTVYDNLATSTASLKQKSCLENKSISHTLPFELSFGRLAASILFLRK